MNFRTGSGAEMFICHVLWANHMWAGLKNVKIVDDVFREEHVEELVRQWGYQPPEAELAFGRNAFLCDHSSPWKFIFCPRDAGLASFVHEVGHAVHDALYPESRGWPPEKTEAFALLADVNMGRWSTMEAHERASFAQHVRACRNHPEYARPLRRAFSLRKLPLKEQMQRIADD